uniref:Protein TIC 214 n=1 Tax=Gastrodia javanica TaxID=2974003 RepID=A0A976YHE8_9ASPA|nr:hypothetical protein RF1 [Gastrodia javanica]UVG40901.1 hypothetical protein RF1 [Gastrodia javanica]
MFMIGNKIAVFVNILVILVGFFYGFLTIFSIGPSFLFLIRTRAMEEGTEKEIAATTGFIAGQLLNLISIYYTPLYKTLDRPHLITILVIPYIFFSAFCTNKINFISTNSIHSLSIQFTFLNNIISQLLNLFILPSSALIRLLNIYMFQYNNKIFFLTSSFCGWLIGHILFMKSISSLLFCIKHNYYLRYKYNKYIISEFINYINRIFSIVFFIISLFYLGRMPSPFFTRKFLYTEEGRIINEKEQDYFEIEINYENNEKERKKINFNDIPIYKNSNLDIHKTSREEDKSKKYLWFENIFVTFLFDYKRWNRPLRYIKNDQFENYLRNEMSQFLFFTCKNDGKKRISFTYPSSLSIFLETMDKKNCLSSISEKFDDEYLFNFWIHTNEKRRCNFNDEFRKRIKKLERNKEKTNIFYFDILEKKTLLCADEKQINFLPNLYDPFLNGPNRINRNKLLSYKNYKSLSNIFLINKIHNIFNKDFVELYHNFVFSYPENKIKDFKLFFDVIIAYEKISKNKDFIIRLNKNISRWSYKLKERLEEEEEDNEEEFEEESLFDINSRRFKHILIYKENNQDTNVRLIENHHPNNNNKDKNEDRIDEVTLIHYSKKSDFRRNLIKGSMRAQRRKIVIWDLFQVNAHSPLFLDRLTKSYLFSSFYFIINELENLIFKNWIGMEFNFENENEKEPKEDQDDHIKITETWDNPLFTQAIRSLILVIQSYFRKYILLPFLIILKNILRILLFQTPEWDKDFKEWSKEMHIKCTYNGIQLSETEFPEDWLIDGIQIKILYPFCLKPWRTRTDKVKSYNREHMKKKDKRPQSFFLTVWGGETEHIFGSPRKQSFIFEPIYKILKKINKKVENIFLRIRIQIKTFFQRKYIYIFFESSNINITSNNINITSNLNKKKKTNWFNIERNIIERNIKDVSDKKLKISKQTEKIIKDKNNLIKDSKDRVSKYYIHLWIILRNINRRLIRKSYSFINMKFKKLYKDLLLWIINFYKIKVNFFFESTIFFLYTYISNISNKKKEEKDVFYEITQNKKNFILIIKNIDQENFNNHGPRLRFILSNFSQAYVFYKLSQNKSQSWDYIKNLKNIFSFTFLKKKSKESCIQKIFLSKLIKKKHNEIFTDVKNDWKVWFSGFLNIQYNYNRLKIEKKTRSGTDEWHKRIYKYNFNKSKEYLIKNNYKSNYLVIKKNEKCLKNYRYDLLLNKYIANSYISSSIYTSLNPFISSTTKKKEVYNNNGKRNNIFYRKYFDYRILHSGLINYQDILYTVSNLKSWFFTEFILPFNGYKEKPWLIPIQSLFLNISKVNISKDIKESSKKIILNEDYIKLKSKNIMEIEQDINNKEIELYSFLIKYLLFQLRWTYNLNKRIIKNIRVYCLLLRLNNPKEIYISSIQRNEIKIDDMLIQKDLVTAGFLNNGIFIFEPIFISIRKNGKNILYQTLDISLNNKYKNKRSCQYIKNKQNYLKIKKNYEVIFPENLFSIKRCIEFRFLICFNSFNKKEKLFNDKRLLLNLVKSLQANKDSIRLKTFLWPNYRVEDIACINRYWFNTNNSSRFSMLKIHMYSR